MDMDVSPADGHAHSASPPTQDRGAAAAASSSSASAGGSAPHISFRRQRASRACETCHSRKVRCDAASLGVPCTNCVAFQIECRIPSPKRKKQSAAAVEKTKDSDSDHGTEERSPRGRALPGHVGASATPGASVYSSRTPAVVHSTEGTPPTSLTETQARQQEVDNETYVTMIMKPKFTRAPITEAGRVAFLGESSNLGLLVHDRQGSADVVHYPLPDNVRGSKARLTELDNVEIDILHQRGAFLLPPRSLCDELIESYFKWVHPLLPVVNRTRFMRQYRDPSNPPSLLLLQSILLAGSRVCKNPQLMDANGSTTPAALTFYKRAKALYDANYEDDRVTIVQSLLMMGWYWEGPEDVTKNVFYWTRVAIIVAQGSGMHRSVEGSQLSRADKRLWKRIWWALFTRDRSVAVALGRPVHINLDDSDVEMLTEEDFIEDEPDRPSEYPPNEIHVQFFLQYVKLCEIMGIVLSQQYSVASKGRRQNAIDLTHSDMALADWLQNCPKSVYWEMPRHHFWAALLHSNYYTTLCLLHRAHMPPGSSGRAQEGNDATYPSRNIAFQAAAMVTSIIENLSAHDELRYCPAFVVYSLFSALIMHVYQLRSPILSIQQVTQDRIRTCMAALKEVSRVWLVGKMVYTLFESILGNRVLEERLQKAPGKRHKRGQDSFSRLEQHQQALQQQQQHAQAQAQAQHDLSRPKFDDMAIDFSVNAPTPQESYERSRPQTPSLTKTNSLQPMTSTAGGGRQQQQTLQQQHQQQHQPFSQPQQPQTVDAFMGGTASRDQTRPPTPFNPSFSVPATPPDLYLVTRDSRNMSQWENFQPDQLFPDASAMPAFSYLPNGASPGAAGGSQPQPHTTTDLDPALLAAAQFEQRQQQQHHQAQQNGGFGLPSQQQFRMSPTQQHQGLASKGSKSPPGPPHAGLSSPSANTGGGGDNNSGNLLQPQHTALSPFGGPVGSGATFWQPGSGAGGGGAFDTGVMDGHSPSDSWSTSSAANLAAPSTLNVEDWFQFFGINGDMNGMNLDVPMT